MTVEAMWQAYASLHPEAGRSGHDAWCYGESCDELLALTLSGRKRATASALPLYAIEGEAVPVAGDYSVLLDSQGNASCILLTTAVNVVPFRDVGADFAEQEGEGDLSLAHWRQVHEAFFTREMADVGLVFTPDTPVVCEEFEVVYR